MFASDEERKGEWGASRGSSLVELLWVSAMFVLFAAAVLSCRRAQRDATPVSFACSVCLPSPVDSPHSAGDQPNYRYVYVCQTIHGAWSQQQSRLHSTRCLLVVVNSAVFTLHVGIIMAKRVFLLNFSQWLVRTRTVTAQRVDVHSSSFFSSF